MARCGLPADVAFVDLTLIGPLAGPPSKVCFGYRDVQGWHVDSGVADLVFDGTFLRAHIPINKGLVDGLYIATDNTSQPLKTITYQIAP